MTEAKRAIGLVVSASCPRALSPMTVDSTHSFIHPSFTPPHNFILRLLSSSSRLLIIIIQSESSRDYHRLLVTAIALSSLCSRIIDYHHIWRPRSGQRSPPLLSLPLPPLQSPRRRVWIHYRAVIKIPVRITTHTHNPSHVDVRHHHDYRVRQ